MLPVSKNIRFGGLIIFIATIAIFTVFHAFGFDRAVIDWARRISLGEPATALPVDVKLRTVFADMPGNRLFGLIDIEDLLALGFFSTAGILAFSVLQNIRLKRTLLAKQQTERANRLLALFDPLTELPNRRNFEDYGANYLKDRSDHERRAIFLIDLDHFKPVNDLYGHAAGDTVLASYAERLKEHFPDGIVSRFGGDEFAVITDPLDETANLIDIAGLCIRSALKPFDFGGVPLRIGASVGIALFQGSSDTVLEALRRADIALYKAKNGGRNQAAFFESALEDNVRERNWLESELRKAVGDGSIVPYFQPYVNLATGDILGYEALARWRHPERGVISPVDFIPIAEECGLITQVGEQILRKAARIALHWPAHTKLSVNFSPIQLREKSLALKIIAILGETGLSPHRLEVEITENALVSDIETARGTLEQLRAAGVSIALDDFGTGYSTLNHLKSCQFDKIKIDRSYIHTLHENRESRLIVDAILGISKSFGVRCAAEGIESAEDMAVLADIGCLEGQGYLFGRPEQQLAGIELAASVPIALRQVG